VFPFGHGLGYTDWQFGAGSLTGSIADGVTATVPIANIGRRDGSTVVQVYVAAPTDGPVPAPRRAVRELRGFTKVTVEAGHTVDAVVELSPRAFAVWSPAEHRWVVPPGTYEVLAGDSSRSLRVLGTVVAP